MTKKKNKVLEKLILLFFDKLKSVHLKSFFFILSFPLTYFYINVCAFAFVSVFVGALIFQKSLFSHTHTYQFFLSFFFFVSDFFPFRHFSSVISMSHSYEINAKYICMAYVLHTIHSWYIESEHIDLSSSFGLSICCYFTPNDPIKFGANERRMKTIKWIKFIFIASLCSTSKSECIKMHALWRNV